MLCCCACGAGDDRHGIFGESAIAVWQAPHCTLESERGWLLATTTSRGCFGGSDTRLLVEWDGDVALASATRTRILGDEVERIEVRLSTRERLALLAEIMDREGHSAGDRLSTNQTLSRIEWGGAPDPAMVLQRGDPGPANELVEGWFEARSKEVTGVPRRRAVARSVDAEISSAWISPP